MVSLFPSFQYIEADGRHCLHHGTTIKSMRIVHPPSRKICFPANHSHWYFLISMRHGWNKNVVAQIWQLKRVQPSSHDYTCRVPPLFPLSSSARRFFSFPLGNSGFAKQGSTRDPDQGDQTRSPIHTAKQEFGIQTCTTPEKRQTQDLGE